MLDLLALDIARSAYDGGIGIVAEGLVKIVESAVSHTSDLAGPVATAAGVHAAKLVHKKVRRAVIARRQKAYKHDLH